MSAGVTRDKRHTRAHPCAICGGFDEQDRGEGKRCAGFDSEDGTWIRCSREEYAGRLEADNGLFRHIARGECRCGATHAQFRASGPPKAEAIYAYRSASGELLCEVHRMPDKRFFQRRRGAPCEKGCNPRCRDGWHWNTEGIPWTLYRLERLAKSSGPVYLVEGEKDVETLERRGLVATTNRGGAANGAGKRCDYSPLRGRDVVLIADADDTGRKHAAEVLPRLREAGARVSGPWECTGGKDVTDHLRVSDSLSTEDGSLVPMQPPGAKPAEAPKAASAPATETRPRPPIRTVPAPAPSDEDVPWSDDEPPREDDPKPEIVMGTDLHRVLRELESLISTLDPGLYQRGRELVTVLGADGERGVADGTPVIQPLSQSAILPRITERVQFVRVTPPKKNEAELAIAQGRKPEPVRARIVPSASHVIQPFLARGEWPTVRLLRGITEAPCLRGDGTILQTPGYDPMTRYLYAPNAEYWPVPEDPTQADAMAALAELRDLFVHFPFTSEAGSVVAIAALLTAFARPGIDGPVPASVFEASVKGSGKSLQCVVVHELATGRPPPHGEWPADEDEQKKAMNTIALTGPPIVVFDNVKGCFGGPSIEAALTSDRVSFRRLGGNTLADVPWTSVVLASGNQIDLTDDMVRRVLISRLEPAEEDPTTRTGLPHLPTIVRSRRPALVRAALAVLRAYACHGFPDTGARLASFEAWARVVPGAIMFAGGPNVCGARATPDKAATDATAAAGTVVRQLAQLLPTMGGGATTKAILARLYPPPEAHDGWDDLREAIETLAPPKGPKVEALLLGKRLRKVVGRWFGTGPRAVRLVAVPDAARDVTLWRTETATDSGITPGNVTQ